MKPLKFRVFSSSLFFSFALHVAVVIAVALMFHRSRPHSEVFMQEFAPINRKSDLLPKSSEKTPEQGMKKPEKSLKADQRLIQDGLFSGAEVESSYTEKLRVQIKNHRIYPVLALKKQLQGVVNVRLILDDQGNVTSVKSFFEPNSADVSPILIQAAEDSVKAASPFLPPPAGISHVFDVPISFRLVE